MRARHSEGLARGEEAEIGEQMTDEHSPISLGMLGVTADSREAEFWSAYGRKGAMAAKGKRFRTPAKPKTNPRIEKSRALVPCACGHPKAREAGCCYRCEVKDARMAELDKKQKGGWK